eukprot:scaffold218993_cov21-Prasinocladus_malaysianus.AAC.1
MAADVEIDECNKVKGSSSLLSDLGRRPRPRSCFVTRWREIVMGIIIVVLAVLVVALATMEKKPTQLPPYCLFAVGGGYMEGKNPVEKQLKKVSS